MSDRDQIRLDGTKCALTVVVAVSLLPTIDAKKKDCGPRWTQLVLQPTPSTAHTIQETGSWPRNQRSSVEASPVSPTI